MSGPPKGQQESAGDAGTTLDFRPGDELVFLPLGGSGEIGMNLNLYGCRGAWLMVDLGVTFGDDTLPGVDVVMPDPVFIAEQRQDLLGLILTHAHEDHLGAVAYLWPRLECPVYATPFTAEILRNKLRETGLLDKVPLIEVPLGGAVTLGPFDIRFITMTHSIPEPNALSIATPFGTVVHTGDWKLDPDPQIGGLTDEAALKTLGDAGVLAAVCDSTNVFREGVSGSEGDLGGGLHQLIATAPHRVAVAAFATNVARLRTVMKVAAACNRQVALVGRSLWRIFAAARATGYLEDVPPPVSEEDAGFFPRDKILLICTGSQGEPRAALSRIANDAHPHVSLEEGDMVIFSSRIIPGNEMAIGQMQNRLARKGIDVVTERDADIHVSGHPARGELAHLYQLVRPRIAVPVHGEWRHMLEHERFARICQVQTAIAAGNGNVLRLAPGRPEITAAVPAGRLCLNGNQVVPLYSEAMRRRRRLLESGAVVATIVIDGRGRLAAPLQVTVEGVPSGEGEAALVSGLDSVVSAALAELPSPVANGRGPDDARLAETLRRAVRRHFAGMSGRKPLTEIHLLRFHEGEEGLRFTATRGRVHDGGDRDNSNDRKGGN